MPNMNFLSYIVAEISLTKNVEKKKEEHIQGRINRRIPVLNPTMQHVIVNLHNINLLSGTVAEKSITKNCSVDCMERKKR